MRYQNITKDDMLNGEGLRVVLWVSGCSHRCPGCHNPITWDPNDGLVFDDNARQEIYDQLDQPYISGITFSGGDPLFIQNVPSVLVFMREIKEKYPHKSIWCYTGYTYEYVKKNYNAVLRYIDVLVDGPYVESLRDIQLPYRGSSNQRIIDVKKSLTSDNIILYK